MFIFGYSLLFSTSLTFLWLWCLSSLTNLWLPRMSFCHFCFSISVAWLTHRLTRIFSAYFARVNSEVRSPWSNRVPAAEKCIDGTLQIFLPISCVLWEVVECTVYPRMCGKGKKENCLPSKLVWQIRWKLGKYLHYHTRFQIRCEYRTYLLYCIKG